VRALANTWISVLRGTTEDEFGDPKDSTTPVHTRIPASLIEMSRQAFTPDSSTPRVVRNSVCRVGPDKDVREDDRVKDEKSGLTYIVLSVSQPGGHGMKNDLRIDLKRTT
jgi:hypothetical protein